MKDLAYRDGQNVYMVVDPRWFRIFLFLAIAAICLIVFMGVTALYVFGWVNDLNIVSRLFAMLEKAASGGCV